MVTHAGPVGLTRQSRSFEDHEADEVIIIGRIDRGLEPGGGGFRAVAIVGGDRIPLDLQGVPFPAIVVERIIDLDPVGDPVRLPGVVDGRATDAASEGDGQLGAATVILHGG